MSKYGTITKPQGISTYRERKERYTKALEDHVADARANEADLHQEIQDLRRTVQKLTAFIQSHGMQLPDEISLAIESSPVAGDIIPADWASGQDQPHHQEQLIDGTVSIPNQLQYTPSYEGGTKTGLISSHTEPLRLGDLDPLAIGMQFVLM